MSDLIHSSPWLTITNKAESVVEIDITGVIGGSFWDDEDENTVNTKEKMRAELKAIAEIKADKIIINIDSPGGSVSHGMSMHDLLAQHKAEKETRIIGMAASIATVIAQVGDKRKISDNALFLPHKAMAIAMGNSNEIQNTIESLNTIDAKIMNIYVKRGADKDKVQAVIDANNGNGKWIDGEEAMEAGLIDEVFEPTKAAAMFDLSKYKNLKYPELPKINNMTDNDVKTFGEKIDTLIEKVTALFSAKPADPPADPPAKTELEIANEKITLFENQVNELKVANEAEKTAIEAEKTVLAQKQIEADNLIKELKSLKNEWVPEGRTSGTGSVEVAGIDKEAVREMRKKTNKTDK
jgi:ATP-dependent Clp protease, protease subunit